MKIYSAKYYRALLLHNAITGNRIFLKLQCDQHVHVDLMFSSMTVKGQDIFERYWYSMAKNTNGTFRAVNV